VARLASTLVLVATAALLGGCVTTQTRNARAKLAAEREIASRAPLVIGRAHPQVTVTGVALLHGARRSAIVVDLRSSAPAALSDLPIAVGVRTRAGRRLALNTTVGVAWFRAHVPAIAARGATTWVFSFTRRLKPGAQPFARVGVPAAGAPVSDATSLPAVQAQPAGTTPRSQRVVVANASDVPQVDLQVYAVARANGRPVAAGRGEIAHVGSNQRAIVDVPLVGRAGGAALRLTAVPTIFK
jgi:hypothetical protein